MKVQVHPKWLLIFCTVITVALVSFLSVDVSRQNVSQDCWGMQACHCYSSMSLLSWTLNCYFMAQKACICWDKLWQLKRLGMW